MTIHLLDKNKKVIHIQKKVLNIAGEENDPNTPKNKVGLN
jgi:hypothetical protein